MKDKSNKAFWERTAGLYGSAMKSSDKLYDAIRDEITPYLNRNMNVLELACGPGTLSFRLAGRVKLWEATDFSPAMIAEAKKRPGLSGLRFSVQDATALPYAPESFDAVVISNALHIMPNPEIALSEIHRVLKSDGILFAPTFIHGQGIAFHLRIRLMELFGFHTFSKWNETQFVSYLNEHGFTITEHRVMGGGLTPLCFAVAKKTELACCLANEQEGAL